MCAAQMCATLSLKKTFGVLDYCQSNFEKCEIYQKTRQELAGLPCPADGDA